MSMTRKLLRMKL